MFISGFKKSSMKIPKKYFKKFFRCQTCGRLSGNTRKDREICSGHFQRYAYYVTPIEWLMIILGFKKSG